MKALAIGVVELKRMMRDRVNLFFMFVFPVILIVLLGVTFGGGFTPKLAIFVADDGDLARELTDALQEDPSVEVDVVADRTALEDDVERGVYEAGIVIPAGYTHALRSGEKSVVAYVAKPGDFSAGIRAAVDSAVAAQSARVRAALVAMQSAGADFDATYGAATAAEAGLQGVDVAYAVAGDEDVETGGQFSTGASTQLVLFTFVNSLAGSVALVRTRQLGVLRRMLAAPVGSSTILLGETLGRFLIALVQGVFIIAVASLVFGVDWGDPLGAAAVVALFALVSTGAAMLFGSVLNNEQQAGALVPFGLVLAALGGCMIPLEMFSKTMKTIAHVTPHAWANEAFEELIGHGADVVDIAPQLGALAGFAVVLLGVASVLLRRKLTS